MSAPETPRFGTTTRRGLLLGSVGTAAGLALAGRASAQSMFGGWLDDADNFDGTVADQTGQSEVTVQVGTPANGGDFGFGPPAVRVDPGTTVVWEWTGNGGLHNVAAVEGADFSSDLTDEAGATFEHTFEEEGVVTYQCDPHVSLGMKGVVVVGDVDVGGGTGGGGGGGGNVQPDFGDWLNGVDGGFQDARGQSEVTVSVGSDGNDGPFAFSPATLWIDPGTTVTFEWVSDTHNVAVESQPEGAGWEGSLEVEDTGFVYEHTFETSGLYQYFCEPHRSLGMLGGIAVGDDVPTTEVGGGDGGAGGEGGGDGGEGGGGLPEGSVLFLTGFGIAGLAVLLVLGAETVVELDKRGGLRGAKPETPGGVTAEADELEPVETLDHDEYDPIGTATLIVGYFVILVLMWFVMYFVEFLGNGPTVIG